MPRLIATALAMLVISPAIAQGTQFRDFVVEPIEKAQGVGHIADCPTYNDTCTLWVRLPKEMSTAQLTYSTRGKNQLVAPLSIFGQTQDQIDALYRPGSLHTFLSGGFFGLRLEISKALARKTSLTVGSGGGVSYKLAAVSTWLQDGR